MHRPLVPVLALALAVLAAACDDAGGPSTTASSASGPGEAGPAIRQGAVASLAELLGPWRPRPLGLDEAGAGRIAAACARDMQGLPGTPPQVIDVRGAGVVIVRLAGPATTIQCDALQITSNGTVVGAGGGLRSDRAEVVQAIGRHEIGEVQRSTVEGGDLSVQGHSILGRAGNGIASVTIDVTGGPMVTATLQNGWFAAWWPAQFDQVFRRRADAPAVRISGFDPSGSKVAELTLDSGG